MPNILASLRKLFKSSSTYTPSQSEAFSSQLKTGKIYLEDLVKPECDTGSSLLHMKYEEPAKNTQQLVKKEFTPEEGWTERLLLRIHTEPDGGTWVDDFGGIGPTFNATFETELTPPELKNWICNIRCYPAHVGGKEILAIKELFQNTSYAFGCAPEWIGGTASLATIDLLSLAGNSSALLPAAVEVRDTQGGEHQGTQDSGSLLDSVTFATSTLTSDFASSSDGSHLLGSLLDLSGGTH